MLPPDLFTPELLAAGAMGVALTFYILLGGADYGAGVWNLLSSGPRAHRQRELVAKAIGPVWEANHVWLVLVVVVLFTGFPQAFAVIATALHVPIALVLMGVLFRGSAFAFQSHLKQKEDLARGTWDRVFAMASLLTPILLGVTVGAISSGEIRVGPQGEVATGFVGPWLAPYPIAVGAFALALFAFLAAVYLTVEAPDSALKEDFRRRALASGVLVGVMALVVFVLAGRGAPIIRARLAASPWTWPLQLSTGALALLAFGALVTRRFAAARVFAALQAAFIFFGFLFAQFPYLVVPDVTVASAAAPRATLRLLLLALVAGAIVLFPSFFYLFRVFKSAHGGSDGRRAVD